MSELTDLLFANIIKKWRISHAPNQPRVLLSVFQSKTSLKGYVLSHLTRETAEAESSRQVYNLVASCKFKYMDPIMQKVGCERVNDEAEDVVKYLSKSADSTAFILITYDGDEATHAQVSNRLQGDIEKLARGDLRLSPVLSSVPLVDPHKVVRAMFMNDSVDSIAQAMKLLDGLPDDL